MPTAIIKPPPIAPIKFEASLEGLRGFAALVVVVCHGQLLANYLSPEFHPAGIWSFIPPGHFSVMVFFILSGYVIGLTNRTPLASGQSIVTYTRKRLQRLYPIYLIVVLISFFVFDKQQGYLALLRHLTFTQALTGPVLGSNVPLWSLNFEIIYYALFIPISYFKWPVSRLIVLSALIGVVATAGFAPAFLAAYTFGFVFWLIGLYISQSSTVSSDAIVPKRILAAYLFLLLSYQHLNFTSGLLHFLSFETSLSRVQNAHQAVIGFSDLGILVFCIPMLLRFTNRHWKWIKPLEIYLFAAPILHLFSKFALHQLDTATIATLFFPICSYILALLFYFTPVFEIPGARIITALIPTGKISYGIYLVHYPVFIYLFNNVNFYNSTAFGYAMRFGLYLTATLLLGYLLELRYQPFIKRLFFSNQQTN